MKIAIFSGNEKWILRGLAIDIQKAFVKSGIEAKHYELDLVNPGIDPPEADWYFFVQQGQLNSILKAWGYKKDLVKKSICIFTHFDFKNCKFELLNSIHLVSHMSSHQMAIAIGNGLSRNNSSLLPLGVDPERHYPVKQNYLDTELAKKYPRIRERSKRSYVGFCTRLWNKDTYTKRKNYECLFEIVNKLLQQNQKVLIVGDGWEKHASNKHKNLVIVDPPYKDYILFYNLMKAFVSVTSYDGGPIPLLESMACGVPPVITNSGFAPDVIKNKEYGLTFQPFAESSEVLRLIKETIDSEHSRETLRKRAIEFSFESYAKKLLKHLAL